LKKSNNKKIILEISLVTIKVFTSESLSKILFNFHDFLFEFEFLFSHSLFCSIIVKVRPARDVTTRSLRDDSTLTRTEKRQAVYDDLVSIAELSQKPLLAALKQRNIEVKSFWISNSLYIRHASHSVVEFLKAHEDVLEVREEKFAHLIRPVERREAKEHQMAITWSVAQINAPAAWAVSRGEGISVANIDTGVRYTHQALIGNYRGNNNGSFDHNYNWFDSRGTSAPVDTNGHGTHTAGTIVGSEASGVGVAPGARWFAAKGCGTILCSEADLTGSAEFVLCPTRLDGSGADCSRGADVVSNSWGGGNGDDWYSSYVDAWRNAGIIPVFAQGNSGPACATANSPGDLDTVIGVGATNSDDALAIFSSRGPGPNAAGFSAIKPDISAPGAAVTSASSNGDALYTALSGTSMACPSVAGVVALLLGANPNLSYQQVYDAITSTASTSIGAPLGGQTTCGNIAYNTFPSNHYGYGRIDALAAVNAVARA